MLRKLPVQFSNTSRRCTIRKDKVEYVNTISYLYLRDSRERSLSFDVLAHRQRLVLSVALRWGNYICSVFRLHNHGHWTTNDLSNICIIITPYPRNHSLNSCCVFVGLRKNGRLDNVSPLINQKQHFVRETLMRMSKMVKKNRHKSFFTCITMVFSYSCLICYARNKIYRGEPISEFFSVSNCSLKRPLSIWTDKFSHKLQFYEK